MENFRRDKRSGGKSFGGGRDRKGSFGGGDRGGRKSFGGGRGRSGDRPEMHSAVCDECGKNCEVPFRPTGDKPVFCSDCFRNKGGSDVSREREGRRDSRDFSHKEKDSSNFKVQLDILNTKLDKILNLLTSDSKKENQTQKTEIKKIENKIIRPKKTVKKEVDNKALKKALKLPALKKVSEKKVSAKKKTVKNK